MTCPVYKDIDCKGWKILKTILCPMSQNTCKIFTGPAILRTCLGWHAAKFILLLDRNGLKIGFLLEECDIAILR